MDGRAGTMVARIGAAALAAFTIWAAPAAASTEIDLDSAIQGFFLMVIAVYLGGSFALGLIVHLFVRRRWWTIAPCTLPFPAALWIAMSISIPRDNGFDAGWAGAFASAVVGSMVFSLIGAFPGAMAGAAIRRRVAGFLKRP